MIILILTYSTSGMVLQYSQHDTAVFTGRYYSISRRTLEFRLMKLSKTEGRL